MSKISLGFTRQAPAVTKEGRENVRPYNKTTYGSNSPLKNGFVEAYGNLLDRLAHDKHDVHCVFQVGVGGGAQRRNGVAGKSAISHRNARTMIVFDLFRPETKESIAAAVEYQRCFEFDVVDKYMTAPINGVPQPKVMAQWASHGDLDMSNKEVWEKYFDIPEDYHRLRAIKAAVDPQDTFHSRFTIRSTMNSGCSTAPPSATVSARTESSGPLPSGRSGGLSRWHTLAICCETPCACPILRLPGSPPFCGACGRG